MKRVDEKEGVGRDQEDSGESFSRGQMMEGRDYYLEKGLVVFTARYLLSRGECCGSNCRHCPYPLESGKR